MRKFLIRVDLTLSYFVSRKQVCFVDQSCCNARSFLEIVMHTDCISLFFSPKTTFERSFIPRAGPSHISNPGGAWQGGKTPVTPLSEKIMIQGPGRFQSGGDELKVDSLFKCYMFISVRTYIYILYTFFLYIFILSRSSVNGWSFSGGFPLKNPLWKG